MITDNKEAHLNCGFLHVKKMKILSGFNDFVKVWMHNSVGSKRTIQKGCPLALIYFVAECGDKSIVMYDD